MPPQKLDLCSRASLRSLRSLITVVRRQFDHLSCCRSGAACHLWLLAEVLTELLHALVHLSIRLRGRHPFAKPRRLLSRHEAALGTRLLELGGGRQARRER